ncbi:hypothetical protein BACCOPRO_00095 [Phocaeicola coprophilus DSM 18228 = JCM 13818]|uniref:Lipoprotein n=1 Tax=Phocaeicola coprophilus DSM 18228 = JCM 13818 TaxID=547042 RepID=S0F7Y2_9BACT|nr:hypothetical protein BACCOPRO_00095 [Phocaeicola coprophilus DSM 18228 = JCM 13818]
MISVDFRVFSAKYRRFYFVLFQIYFTFACVGENGQNTYKSTH